jgi:hypothetical protein
MSSIEEIPPSDHYEPNERSIRFTQYMLPNGRQETHYIERDGPVLVMARAIESAGFVFECEMLRDYTTVSFEILRGEDRDDSIAHELVANGPGVPAAVDKLIADAFAALQLRNVGA